MRKQIHIIVKKLLSIGKILIRLVIIQAKNLKMMGFKKLSCKICKNLVKICKMKVLIRVIF